MLKINLYYSMRKILERLFRSVINGKNLGMSHLVKT